jgi:hypothetical protein
MLKQRTNPRTGKKEYALVSRDGKRVLQYFGKARPSAAAIAQAEARVEHYATKGKS